MRKERFHSAMRWIRKDLPRSFKLKRRSLLASVNRRLSSARFVAVTGSSGKTTTTALLAHLLSAEHKVRSQLIENSLPSALSLLRRPIRNVDFAVAETGTMRPGDLKRIVDVIKPHVAIVTMVAVEHYTSFRGLQAVADEKATLVRELPDEGLAILNADDPAVRSMASLTRARTVFFGSTGSDYVVESATTSPEGHLRLVMSGKFGQLELVSRLLGRHNWLSVAAATTCALELGVAPSSIIERLATFEPVGYRMSRHKIPGGPIFILDTCKAPLHSLLLPLETLRQLKAPRKRFVLGQISDYPGNPRPKYRDAYRAARDVADQVIFVGPNSHRSSAPPEDIEAGRFRAFSSVEEASRFLKETAIPDEVILVKSSANLHLERLYLDWAHAVECWPDECGRTMPCQKCGLYLADFSVHGGKPAKSPRRLSPGSLRMQAQ